MKALLRFGLVALMAFSCGVTLAHESRPGYLEIRQESDTDFLVLWKQPAIGGMRLRLNPIFPTECRSQIGEAKMTGEALLVRTRLTCPTGLAGKRVYIEGIQSTLTDVLVRVYYQDGTQETHLLRPNLPSVALEGTRGPLGRAGAYFLLGIQHIVLGVDHLLFVLGLLLIVSDRWMLIKTVSSFTLAHSITLAIATLGYASAPLAPLNAAIAMSILFLGPEIVRNWRGQTSLTIRHPWVVAFFFGLLHGFGFATGLTAMGLPEAEIPLALLLFNVGVEAGQIFFVLLIVLLEKSFVTLEIRWPRFIECAPGYAVGTLGAFWTIQRTLMIFGVR